MVELSQKIFLQWLEIVLSQSLKEQIPSYDNNDTEQCYSTNILSKNFTNLQISINIELVLILKNVSEPINRLCFSSKKWHLKLLEPKSTTTINYFIATEPGKYSTGRGFSKTKIVLISFCGIILAVFFVVVIIMRIRNYMKRRTKLYRDSLSPGLPVIYQDFDLNPRSEERHRYYHYDMQWARYPYNHKQEINHQIKTSNLYVSKSKDSCNNIRCKPTETIKVIDNARNCSLRPLMNSCNLAEIRKAAASQDSKESGLESSLSGVQSASTKRRRHSLVDQIESVMNKHFDKNGVNKTWSNENLKCKSTNHSLLSNRPGTMIKSGTRSNSKIPYRFRKTISLRRRLSTDEFTEFSKKTQSYRQNINVIS